VSLTGWIAWRYLRTRKQRFAALITWVSLTGLTLGVLVLTVVVSVMNGFDAELRGRILGTVPHLMIEDVTLPAVEGVLAEADFAEVRHAYPFFIGSGMVTRAGAVNPVSVYGIDADRGDFPEEISRHLTSGRLEALAGPPYGIAIGLPLAGHLGALPGDDLALIVTEPTDYGLRPKLIRLSLAATFELGAELDYSVALLDRRALGVAEPGRLGVDGVRLVLDDPLQADGITRRLRALAPDWRISSWTDSYGELFQAVQLEKALMFLILLMVVAVAAFNIVSGQMMLVNDRRSDIAILLTMGAPTRLIRRVFLLQGLVVSSLGIAVGLLLGVVMARSINDLLALVERTFGFSLLQGTYFVEVPVRVLAADLAVIAGLSWLLCLLSAWLPARRAAQVDPVQGLHAA